MSIFTDLFTWWNGATLSTRLYTSRHGRLIGEDSGGNKYYEAKDAKSSGPAGKPRRWVVYKGVAEASKVPPEWHGWLHYIHDEPPGRDYQAKGWQKPHIENRTGTPEAYRPAGSILNAPRRRVGTPDYEPWRAE